MVPLLARYPCSPWVSGLILQYKPRCCTSCYNLKVKYKGILFYEILMDCVARKRMQKTTSNYLKWFPRYCDLNFYVISLIFMSSSMTS